ncbi:MAG: ATP-binding protein, partial [Tepidisphaeraceae bacterium]
DTRLVYLVLKNLVENSIKFTPSGGRVTVSFQQSPGPIVTLTVADTGIGIAPEHIERVFERFYQVDAARSGSAGRGTGLGLAIVKHAVHALGGTVRLQSAVGAGTTVTCEFPQTIARESEHDSESTAA